MSTTSDTTNLFSMGIGFESPRNFDYVSAFKDTQDIRVSGEYAELEQPVNRIDFYLKSDIGIGPHNVELPEVKNWVTVNAGLINTRYSPITLKLTITAADHANKQIVAHYEINAKEDHPEGSGTPIIVKGHFYIHYK